MIAVLVASADSRRDVFDTCFAHSERIWAECRWPRYVGLNTPSPPLYGFQVLCANVITAWTAQVAAYVDCLPPEVEYVLLMVEDALFMQPVDGVQMYWLGALTRKERLKYVRLVPLRRNWFGRFIDYFNFDPNELRKIPRSEPYYSSTEMVLWERGYLRQLLSYKNDAWSFEHLVTGVDHWAVWGPILSQHQIVTRGRWARGAPALLAKVGLAIKGNRPHQTRRAYLRGLRENLSFRLFGFLSFRIKRKFR